MASFRVVVTLVLALTLCCAAPAAAQAIGPICLEASLGGVFEGLFEIFALPLGGTASGSQLLLSAVSLRVGVIFTGSALLGEFLATFSLFGATHTSGNPLAALTFSGIVDLATGTGEGACSTIDGPAVEGRCGTSTPVTYTLVSCDDA
jgi:hypothetical protein